MNRRQWHIAFLAALGARNAARMNDADLDDMRDMRSRGITPITAARLTRQRIAIRHGITIR